MPHFFLSLLRCRRGAAAIEYGVLIALVAIAVVAALRGMGSNLNTTMTAVSNEMPAVPNIPIQTTP